MGPNIVTGERFEQDCKDGTIATDEIRSAELELVLVHRHIQQMMIFFLNLKKMKEKGQELRIMNSV